MTVRKLAKVTDKIKFDFKKTKEDYRNFVFSLTFSCLMIYIYIYIYVCVRVCVCVCVCVVPHR